MDAGTPAPVFIVGIPRSGTHLLRYCLNQHPSMYILPETGFFFKIYGNRRLIRGQQLNRYSQWITRRIFQSGDPSMKDFESIREDLELKIRTADKMSYYQLMELIGNRFAGHKQKKLWGEKTPNHLFFVPHILQLFPRAKLIFLTRSMKNTIASYVKSSHVTGGFEDALVHSLAGSEAIYKYQHHGLTVSYEALTDHPEQVLNEVCEFIGIDFNASMLQPKMVDSSYNHEIMKFDENVGILPDDPDKWKQVLHPRQADIVDYYFGVSEKMPSIAFMAQLNWKKTVFKLRKYKDYVGFENLVRGFIPANK